MHDWSNCKLQNCLEELPNYIVFLLLNNEIRINLQFIFHRKSNFRFVHCNFSPFLKKWTPIFSFAHEIGHGFRLRSNTVNCELCKPIMVQYSLCNLQCSLFTVCCSLFTVHCSLFTVPIAQSLCIVKYSIINGYCAKCTVCSMFTVQYALTTVVYV